jgi:hypothetical protein
VLGSWAAAAADGQRRDGVESVRAHQRRRGDQTAKAGVCPKTATLTELGAEGKQEPEGKNGFTAGELALLKSIVPYMKYVASGVGGKPTIQFSGVNVQIVNGKGKTAIVDGVGQPRDRL